MTRMRSLTEIKDETAEELGYYGYAEFDLYLQQESLVLDDIRKFIELYATNRVKEVENYYKKQDDEYEQQPYI